jgi:hypothetical protein
MNGEKWCYIRSGRCSWRSPAIGYSYLLAYYVGTGKTIEAGLIMRELKLRAKNGNDEVKSWFVEIESKTNVEVSHV